MRSTCIVPLADGQVVSGMTVNHLGVIISHDKDRREKGITMAVLPVNIGPDMFEWVIRPHPCKMLEPRARLHRPSVDKWAQQCRDEVAARSGDLWDFIVQCAANERVAIAGPRPTDQATEQNFDKVAG